MRWQPKLNVFCFQLLSYSKYHSQAQILSAEFKQISAEERAKWDALALKDKERYQREMADYVPPDDLEDYGRGKKKKKDPNAPKRNMSAFFIYSNAVRPQVKEENPEAGFGDIAKIISKQYKALPEKELAIYQKKAVEDKERYQREMRIYNGEE